MKKQFQLLFLLSITLMLTFAMSSFTTDTKSERYTGNQSETLEIPDEVNTILDNKCFGCHNVEAKSDKAKKKLLLDELPTLSKAKMVAKLDDIHEVVLEGEMPPAKFLEKFPDKALTDEEADILRKWAKSASDKLMGE